MLDAVKAGLAQAHRKASADLAGLPRILDPESEESPLLREMLAYLRDYLLDRYTNDEARALLVEYEAQEGFRGVTPTPRDVKLALALLNMFRDAAHCEPERFATLVLGKAGARDRNLQASKHHSKRPKLDAWIARRLQGDPDAKSPELWAEAPEWLTEGIGFRAFAMRVTQQRKLTRL